MKKIRWLMLLLSLCLAWLLGLVSRGIAQEIDRVEAARKIAPWVIDHTVAGQMAEFLVVLADQADVRGADRLPSKLAKGRYVVDTVRAQAQRSQQALKAWLQQRGVEYRSFYIVNAIWVKADRETALALAARSDVARLDGNPLIDNDVAPPENSSGPQSNRPDNIEPGIAYVHAPQVWNLGFTGQGVVVGGQDTGYRWDHAALQAHYRGWDGISVIHDYNWHDSIHANTHGFNSCGVNSAAPCDDYGHGTHTMGTIIGNDGGANQIGMAPGAQWIGCRNMDNGWGSPASYLECFEFFLAPYPVMGTPAQGDPSKAPDVTNNSWSCPAYEGCNAQTLLQAVQVQRAAGIMTVVSAANDGPACSTIDDPPAVYDEAYTVGALNTGSDTIAGFSSLGPVTSDSSGRRKPDVGAPGTNTRSSTRDGNYGFSSGTSMAAPHVAGAVALLWSARPAYRHEITFTEQLLNQAAVHLSSTACGSNGWPNNTFGYGRLDVFAAVTRVLALSQTAKPGQWVTYTLHFTNTSTLTDTFTLLAGAHLWLTTITPTQTASLRPSASFTATIAVSVPVNAAFNASDALAITAVPALAQTNWSFAELTTHALKPLPLHVFVPMFFQ